LANLPPLFKAEMRGESRRFASSGRFTRHGWRLDVYLDFLGLAAATKLTAEKEEERSGNDDQKDHKYGHHCGVAAATTIVISHKIYPPSRTNDSLFVGDVTVSGD
jgi:hypothetical protein